MTNKAGFPPFTNGLPQYSDAGRVDGASFLIISIRNLFDPALYISQAEFVKEQIDRNNQPMKTHLMMCFHRLIILIFEFQTTEFLKSNASPILVSYPRQYY
ncbi:hypothetical protein CLOSTMETH_03061 [[Clostridium] methylpentosum DSM 5476]|uniref:Uncharacterized protein n=1 Tax=[Clostridium] methylpentosum DSM 5476 TaxID=537013 RepID=C0EGR8_9FIRM|nr:hypothetical protein CLOSTMETH_03061 [[Clostridium] methylpentosum DSM 5476]